MKALLRRSGRLNADPGEQKSLSLGGVLIDEGKRAVTAGGENVELTYKEYELLKLMMEHEGTTLKKDYLFNNVWGSDSESELQTLTVHIKWLREKLEKDPKKPEHIITVWGVGYRFEA